MSVIDNVGIISLIPPIITILVAYFYKKVHLALFLGILSGAFLYQGSFSLKLNRLFFYLKESFTNLSRIKISLFIVIIAGLLKVIEYTKANLKFGEFVGNYLNSTKKARILPCILGTTLFFDDYANVLITGASMKPVTSKHNVKPEMLAYFADVLATYASIILISTWAAFEISLISGSTNGLSNLSAVSIFIKSLPFHFYTLLNILLVYLVAFTGKWFYGNKKKDDNRKKVDFSYSKNARKRDIIIPIISIIFFSIVGIFTTGYFNTPNNQRTSFIKILENAPSIDILIISSIISVILLFLLMIKDDVIKKRKFLSSFINGIKGILPTVLIIILAKGLELTVKDLNTGKYITQVFKPYMSIKFIPLFVFIISGLITAASGFSWSSMALVMPIAVQMIDGNSYLLYPSIAATISGAILGAQLVPYSDKSVMTAAAVDITPVFHIKTQFLQIIFVAGLSVLAYLFIGFGLNLIFIYPIILIVMLIGHFLFAD